MQIIRKYEIAVVMINFNSSNYTINCIKSIIEKTSSELLFQIVVVDNCSEKEDYQKLKSFCESSDFQELQLVRNSINVGFGAGNMFGITYTDANYYAFVNNDSILQNDCLSIVLKAMKENDNYGVCGPQAYKENGDLLTVLDHFISPTKELLGRKFLETTNPKKYPNRKKEYQQPQQAQFISGSFLILKALDFEEIGGFDTTIFLYFEETDLCKRLAQKGKFTFLIPAAKYIHFHGASTPSSIAIKIEHKISFIYMIRKHYGYFWYRFMLHYLQIQYGIKCLVKPKYWKLFKVLLLGAPTSKSLKLQQKIVK